MRALMIVVLLLSTVVSVLASRLSVAMTVTHSPDLSVYLWKNRVLLLLADSTSSPLLKKQQFELRANEEEVYDRDLVIVIETSADGPLHEQFRASAPFTAILIGKDGGEKWRKTSAFRASEVFREIDTMPMRKSEKSSSNRL